MAEPAVAAPGKELTREQREYQFRRIVAHLSEAEAWPKIFDLLETKPFLADQADHFGGFEPSGADVERYAVPAAIRLADWSRFLRYASLALNLRGLAESLAEPDILRALVRDGRLGLARDVADRLSDPLRRAQARSVLASACRSRSDLLPDLLRGIEENLEEAAPTPPALAAIARLLGPELASRWTEWIARLPAETAGPARVWAAVAGSWLDRGETQDPGLWEALARIGDRDLLLEQAVRLGLLDRGPLDETLTRLASLFGDDETARWQVIALYLNRQTRRRPERAVLAWEHWVESEPIVWTADLVEACREVLKRLIPARMETFFSGLDSPEARAALRIADLEARPDSRRTALALEAAGQIPDGPAKLHWSLRYLEARPADPAEEIRGQIGAVAAYLHELRYGAAAGDLRRFLDLAARFYPEQLGRLIEDVAWSPASRPETLLTLAAETQQETVAAQLLEHAERFAAAASLTEAEGFKLRGELIRRAACPLCLLRKDLQGLATAVERLLPEEEDELRETLAPALAEMDRKEEARAVAEGIRDPRRRFLTLLRVLPASALPTDVLSSRSLYGAMASARPLDEELLALSALLQNPFDPQDLARRYLLPLSSSDLQAQGLLRLARHALAFQRSFYGKRQDRVAALEVVRGSLAVETDERLVALTPEIAALGSELGLKEAVAELQEAGRQLAGLATVPWSARAAALEHLLSLVGPVFLAGAPESRGRRKAVAVLESIARLPMGPSGTALDELRSHWHEILPMLIAAVERFPGCTVETIARAVREGTAACDGAGGEAAMRIFALCLAPPEERTVWASPEPSLLRALSYLLAAPEPGRTVELVRRLPAVDRDFLGLRLIRFHWIDPEAAVPLAGLIAEPAQREEALSWLQLGKDSEEEWLRSLTALAASRSLDPSEPGRQPLLDRLWACDPGRSRPALAAAFPRSLQTGGRQRGEAALRLWLHAHLAPTPGTEQPQALQRGEQASETLRRSLILSPRKP
jgi:hypothetical protein